MTNLVLASRNSKKVNELQNHLDSFGIEIISLSSFPDAGEIEETGSSFEENAAIKAETVSRITGRAALADDSGLVVDALGGRPGIYSARFSGNQATDEENNHYLLTLMEQIIEQERSASFVCVLALSEPQRETRFFKGFCHGQILFRAQGNGGFGYDPLFYVPSLKKTFAQATTEEKSLISHRGNAIRAFVEYLKNDNGYRQI